jgi:hypothetical protein
VLGGGGDDGYWQGVGGIMCGEGVRGKTSADHSISILGSVLNREDSICLGDGSVSGGGVGTLGKLLLLFPGPLSLDIAFIISSRISTITCSTEPSPTSSCGDSRSIINTK